MFTFSKKLLWLKVGRSNHDPRVMWGITWQQWKKLKVNVSNKYLISFGVLKCMLILVRMDCGTENVKVATVQYAFPARHSYRVAVERSFI